MQLEPLNRSYPTEMETLEQEEDELREALSQGPGPEAERPRLSARQIIVSMVSILTVILTLRYIVWRTAINNWQDWWISCPLLIAEIFTALHILGYQYTIWPRRNPPLCCDQDPTALPVFIFIPTVNEGRDVLEPTVLGAVEASSRYRDANPRARVTIVVCNDGYVAGADGWQDAVALAREYGIECITRTRRGGAKAGNIENARKQVGATGDSLIMVLDADQVARPDFLLRTIPAFQDPAVGWVQTRQYYRNQESRISRWAESQAALFYDFVCPGKAAMNSSFICGTNVVIRAQVLDSIGGFPQESITEDFAASIRTHDRWRSVYMSDVLAEGLGPMDLTAYFVQQSRWARGTIGVLLSDWKRVVKSGPGSLRARQKIQYFLSGTHYFCGLRDFIFLTSAVVCLVTDNSPVTQVSLLAIISYLLPYIAATQLLICLQAGGQSIARAMAISYISFPVLLFSMIEAVTNRRVAFIVTPKSQTKRTDLRAAAPHIALSAICIGALVYAAAAHTAWTVVKCIPLFWVAYALIMLSPAFFLAKFSTKRAAA